MYRVLYPFSLGRLAMLAGVMLPFAMWWKSIDHDVTVVDESEVVGAIVSVTESRMSGKFGSSTMRIARVRLPDGGEARIALGRSGYVQGQSVDLRVRTLSDGSREVFALN